jgi:outer membrane protein assembly factor BamE (lipoprotein component of BamABCDE complex)
LGLDYGREKETLQQWTAKMIVTDDPNIKIASFPDDIKNAIRQGRLTKGMTKEQVIMSVGYPLTSENSSLDARVWRMWVSSFEEYQVIWGSNGLVEEITGDPTALTIVVYKP